jgi:Rrf2 family iron-sulfur cluster assembly transcriptional regulator
MLELGDKADSGQRMPATQVAQRADIPLAFLRKIVVDLTRAGLVRAYSGPTGGLVLAQPAASINLVHILEAIEGPVCLNTCLLRPKDCPRDHICPAHNFLGRLQATLIRQLQEATLDRLVAEKRELEQSIGHGDRTLK